MSPFYHEKMPFGTLFEVICQFTEHLLPFLVKRKYLPGSTLIPDSFVPLRKRLPFLPFQYYPFDTWLFLKKVRFFTKSAKIMINESMYIEHGELR